MGIYLARKASKRWRLQRLGLWRGALKAPIKSIQRARRALRGRLHPALPVEGATQAPIIE
ncbi:MAG: hypothetical protein AABZ05_05725 [Nitrospirota bacterium]